MNVPRALLGRVVAAVALAAAGVGQARADAYGFAQQTVTGLTFTGSTLDGLSVVASTSASQSQGAAPPGSSGDVAASPVFATTDPAAAFVGNGTVAPNTFTPLGQVNPDYIRSDALVNAAQTTFSAVAEGFLTPLGTSSATGSYSFSSSFTLAAAGTVTLSGSVSSILNVVFNGGLAGLATAGYSFVVGITNRATGVTTTFTPTLLNNSITLTTTSTSSTTTPVTAFSITTGTLAAGTYDASLQASSRVFLTQAVPEPSSVAMLGMAGLGMAGLGLVRKRKAATGRA